MVISVRLDGGGGSQEIGPKRFEGQEDVGEMDKSRGIESGVVAVGWERQREAGRD